MNIYYASNRIFTNGQLVRIQFDPSRQNKGVLCIDENLVPGTYEIGNMRLHLMSAGKNYGMGVVRQAGLVKEGDLVSRLL